MTIIDTVYTFKIFLKTSASEDFLPIVATTNLFGCMVTTTNFHDARTNPVQCTHSSISGPVITSCLYEP